VMMRKLANWWKSFNRGSSSCRMANNGFAVGYGLTYCCFAFQFPWASSPFLFSVEKRRGDL
jgi:hypothetical protein